MVGISSSARRLTGEDRGDDRSCEQVDGSEPGLAGYIVAAHRRCQAGQRGERHDDLDETAPREAD